MKKNLVSLLLCGILAAAALSGCAKDAEEKTDGSDGSDGGSVETVANSDSEEVPTYRVAIVRPNEGDLDFLESGVLAELEEQYGVNIEWEVYYRANWSEQKPLLLASRDLPDAFFSHACELDNDVVKDPDLFLELTDLIGENMPNFQRILEEDPEMMALAKDREGKIWGLVNREPFVPQVEMTLYINQDWLNRLNLSVPATYLELEDVMRAFVEKDADGDGDPDNETAMTGFGYAGMNVYMDGRGILAPFGLAGSRSRNYMGLVDGEPAFIPTEEKFKEAVIWMHQLYADGILDSEYFTANSSMNGSKNAGCVWTWNQPGPNFVEVEALAGPDGNRYADHDASTSLHRGELYVTSSCKNPEKLLQWADGFYTGAVSLQTYFGSIPDCVADHGDGTYEVLVPANGDSLSNSAWENSFKGWCPSYMDKEFEGKVILPKDEDTLKKLAQDSLNGKYAYQTFPVVKFTTEEAEELAGIQQDIINYAEMQYAHWVVEGGIEEEWDAYIEQMNDMQLQRYVEIQKSAYQAYLDNSK